MKLPAWADWRVLLGGGSLVAVVVYAVASSSSPKRTPAAPSAGGPVPVLGALVAQPGATYFAAVTTHRGANLASVGDVEAYARKHGFVDVVVRKERPAAWPVSEDADFYVRATYAAATSKEFPRHEGGIAGSVDVSDVWRA